MLISDLWSMPSTAYGRALGRPIYFVNSKMSKLWFSMFSKYYAFSVSYSCIVSNKALLFLEHRHHVCLLSCLLCCRSFLLYRFVDDVALNHGHIELGVFLQEVVLLILDSRDFSTVAPFPKFGWGGTKATDMIWCVDRGYFLHSRSLHACWFLEPEGQVDLCCSMSGGHRQAPLSWLKSFQYSSCVDLPCKGSSCRTLSWQLL